MKIGLLGDICGGDLNYKIGWGLYSKYFAKDSHRLLSLNNFLKDFDLVLGNLESPVTRANFKNESFLGSIELLKFLKSENINYLNIANNHILDHGQEVYVETKNCLALEGLFFVGDYRDSGSNVVVYEKHGIRIGICGFNRINNYQNNKNYANFNLTNIKTTIEKLKQEYFSDLIIISIHWGLEYISIPSIDMVNEARQIIGMGADIIHGHHPHVILPYEKHKNGFIFYSLGNFLMDINWWPAAKNGLVIELLIDNKEIQNVSYYQSFLTNDKIVFKKITNSNSLLLDTNGLLDEKQYLAKQRKLHRLQKIFSYIYLLTHLFKVSKSTYMLIYRGILKKFYIGKN